MLLNICAFFDGSQAECNHGLKGVPGNGNVARNSWTCFLQTSQHVPLICSYCSYQFRFLNHN